MQPVNKRMIILGLVLGLTFSSFGTSLAQSAPAGGSTSHTAAGQTTR